MFDFLFAQFAPHECLGCKSEGFVLCPTCTARQPKARLRCYYCQQDSPEGRTCRSCRATRPLWAARACVPYVGLPKQAIWLLKFQHARQAATDMAITMTALLASYDPGFYITHAPTATTRVRQRGFDQAELIARQVARRVPGASYVRLLARTSNRRQVGAKRDQRFAQQQHAFRVTKQLPTDSHVIIIDDVITTGATLEAAAQALNSTGLRHVEALTFAQA